MTRTSAPVSCRWCRREETTFLLTNNHGGGMGLHAGHCMAQYLTRNHVTYDLRQVADLSTRDRAAAIGRLRGSIEHAARLWDHMDDRDWLDQARGVLANQTARTSAPAHADLVASEAVGLW